MVLKGGGGEVGVWKRLTAAAGVLIFASFLIYCGSVGGTFAQCSAARASSYVDDLNPDLVERATTALVCEGQAVAANAMLLDAGSIAFAIAILIWALFIWFGSAITSSPLRGAAVPSKRPADGRLLVPNHYPIERQTVSDPGPSIISSTVKMSGSLISTGSFQIDGIIDGDIQCSSLVIAETGQVYGQILAERVVVRGRFKGSIHANQIVLCPGSQVEGTLSQKSLEVQFGAHFDGDCHHSDDPPSKFANRLALQPHNTIKKFAVAGVESV
jgi:cytoskeletal protein CcmA (bactofilin family)